MWKFLNLALWTISSASLIGEEIEPFICRSNPDLKSVKEEETVSFPFAIGYRSFLLNYKKHWPKGIIPYEIDSSFTPKQVKMIKSAMNEISSASCVKWVPRKQHEDYISINHDSNDAKCNSVVGRKGGRQPLNLGNNCFLVHRGYQGAILHEMMHALGFIHEQQRLDRDCYVKVLKLGAETRKFDYGITANTDTSFPYDFGSIMHYGRSNFMSSLNGEKLGNYEGHFTVLDKMKLNYMYCRGKSYCDLQKEACSVFKHAQQKCAIHE